jgi:predicted nucleotidyltransferase
VEPDSEQLLRALLDAGLEFVVIGGAAALAHGALTPTRDLDVAAPLTEDNLRRLMQALAPFHPHYATRPDLGVVWHTPAELTKFRLLLLDTDIGRLDVLGNVEPIGGFESLESVELQLVPGRPVRVLSLDQLIAVKAHLRRPKDKIVEAELRSIRARRQSPP